VSDESQGGGEKVFDPTPQRLEQARRKGDVPRSNDVSAAAAYLGLLAAVLAGGAWAVERAGGALTVFLAQPDRLTGMILGPGGQRLSGAIVGEVVAGLAPLLLAPAGLVLAGLVAQRALVFSGEKLAPKLSRVSVLKNARQKFGPTGLVEFAKAVVKLAAISTALFVYLSGDLDRMIGAVRAEPAMVGGMMVDSVRVLLAITCAIAVTIAAVDVAWQRFDHARRLRMSFQELREESKEHEGDPHMKAQRRRRAEEIATNRMLIDVPKADVVIVNPVHVAVALRWARTRGTAPTCVAKGEGEVARRVRDAAAEAGVPIHRDPPTARALHATVELGREIHPEHYRAVAVAIRFADKMRKAARERGAP
jgi:flagellar biosynthesis protein FlhB